MQPLTILDEKIAALATKLPELINKYKVLHDAYLEVLEENEILQKQLLLKNEQLKDFQDKLEVANIVDQVEKEGADWNLLRNKIDIYIEQIDQCIGLLDKEP